MLIKEYRVVLPISVEEYQVGQLYAVAEASKNETGGGEGVEVIENRPYEENGEKGQYTHKIYHLNSKVPGIIRTVAPKGALAVHEEAWNAYPYCRTILTNEYMDKDFIIKIETWHKPDMGNLENIVTDQDDHTSPRKVFATVLKESKGLIHEMLVNLRGVTGSLKTWKRKRMLLTLCALAQVHGLDEQTWGNVDKININIADRNSINAKDYKPEQDPTIFQSKKTGRGPLGPDWMKELANNPDCPHMCAYKLVTINFRWKVIGNQVERRIHQFENRLFTNFHRQLFCSIDKWIDMSMDDIRHMEDETKAELDEMRKNEDVKGMPSD